jgi:hypothetical protein
MWVELCVSSYVKGLAVQTAAVLLESRGSAEAVLRIIECGRFYSPPSAARFGGCECPLRDLCSLLVRLGFAERIKAVTTSSPMSVFPRFSIFSQELIREAYQVKQVRKVVVQYKPAEGAL